MIELTDLQLGYLAGIIDGEGCVSLAYRLGKYVTPTLQITNTNCDVIDWLLAVTKVGTVYVVDDNRLGRKQRYLWRCAGQQAREIIRLVRPYLVIKAVPAEIILKLHDEIEIGVGQHNSRGRKLTDEQFSAIDSAVKEIRKANKRGVDLEETVI